MTKQGFKKRAGFEKAIVAGVVDAVVPFQAVLERLAADVARANKCRAMKVAIIIEVGEQVSLHVKAAARRLEHAHLRALLLQQHQQPQRRPDR